MAKVRQLLAGRGFKTLKQCDNERLKTQILRYCPHFELLAPVMAMPGRPTGERSNDSDTETKEGQAFQPSLVARTLTRASVTSQETDRPMSESKWPVHLLTIKTA